MIDKLHLYEMMIPGDFGLEFKVPIWLDNIDFDTTPIKKYAIENIFDKKLHFKNSSAELKDAHWNKENFFSLDYAFVDDAKNAIKKSYEEFAKNYGIKLKNNLWINGWINVLSDNQYVKLHCHSLHQNSHLTGVIVIKSNENTCTNFYLPQFEHIEDVGIISVINHDSDIMFFPQWLYHSVGKVENDVRITLAFDLFTEESIDFYHANNKNLDAPIKRAIKL